VFDGLVNVIVKFCNDSQRDKVVNNAERRLTRDNNCHTNELNGQKDERLHEATEVG